MDDCKWSKLVFESGNVKHKDFEFKGRHQMSGDIWSEIMIRDRGWTSHCTTL